MKDLSQLPIGVFDSGVGGLTVLNALRKQLPSEDLLYLGDTARVPYGTKSAESVTRYAEQAAAGLIERGIKLLVIACNTASAVAVEPMRALYPDLLVIGVVVPGAEACCNASKNKSVGVIATESTVNNRAYHNAINVIAPEIQVAAQACSLFVALAEEGWHQGELVEQIVSKCLKPLVDTAPNIDTLVLGCTHFPVLKEPISRVLGDEIQLVDSAETTAVAVADELIEHSLLNPQSSAGSEHYLVTDGPERFSRVARQFMDRDIELNQIELVDIQHFKIP